MSILSSATKSVRAVTVAIVAAAFLAFGALPASAHDALTDSNPSDGETLTKTTDVIVLSFNNNIADLGGKILITPAQGEKIEADLKADGKDAFLELAEPLANDTYGVSWRVVSSDSHPIEGTFTFTVEDPNNIAEPEETATPEPTQTPETTQTPAETTQETTEQPGITATLDAEPEEAAKSGVDWGRMAIFGGVGAAVGVVLVILGNKRGRKL